MEKAAYLILIALVVCWLSAVIFGLVVAFPVGLIGLVGILAVGLLFIKVLRERVAKAKDDRYSRDVKE